MNAPVICAPCENRLHQTSIRETTLDGQRAIVTGANSGIGESIARGLAEAGTAVVVNYVTGAERADEIVADIIAAGGKASPSRPTSATSRKCKRCSAAPAPNSAASTFWLPTPACSRMPRCTK